jgi:hypothetical protein
MCTHERPVVRGPDLEPHSSDHRVKEVSRLTERLAVLASGVARPGGWLNGTVARAENDLPELVTGALDVLTHRGRGGAGVAVPHGLVDLLVVSARPFDRVGVRE